MVKHERRAPDRPLKRMRQLQVRLETLLRDARALRLEGAARTGDQPCSGVNADPSEAPTRQIYRLPKSRS